MTTKTWNFTIEGQAHTLILEHNGFSGKHSIVLDGQLLEYFPGKLINLIDSGRIHEYLVKGHSLVLIIQPKIFGFAYDLFMDESSVTTGKYAPQRVYTSRHAAILWSLFLLLFGFGISLSLKNNYEKRLSIQEWPVITGEIANVAVNEHERQDDSGVYYLPYITVKYIVSDSPLTVQIEDETQAFNIYAEALAVHHVGDDQKLYVNPTNPKEVMLYYEKLPPNGWIVSASVMMGLFTGMSILLFLGLWFSGRNRKQRSQEHHNG